MRSAGSCAFSASASEAVSERSLSSSSTFFGVDAREAREPCGVEAREAREPGRDGMVSSAVH